MVLGAPERISHHPSMVHRERGMEGLDGKDQKKEREDVN